MDLKTIRKYGGVVIELKHETGWKKPIQATMWTILRTGKVSRYDYFAQWDTFEEAIEFFRRHHKEPIIINPQIQYGCSWRFK